MNSRDDSRITGPRIFYEIFIRSFCDSNGDGIGDLNGITSRLDYLADLGVEGIWLTPFCLSPSYHKYDVVDYMEVDPEYGTLEDLARLLEEAHRRGLKVIMDFVVNHTSSRHLWFREALEGPQSHYRDYYLWMTPEAIKEMGVALRQKTADSMVTEPWHLAHPGDSEKYYGMFWKGMPDLNMDNKEVRERIYDIGKFWLEFGFDGFRMDAARHIYPDWEAEKTHEFWVEFRARMEAIKPGFYLVGEVWTSAEKVAPFFRGLKANFHFDLSFALQELVRFGRDTREIIPMLLHSYEIFARENSGFIDATMLTNHDQERIGSVLKGDIDKLKVAANLLLTLPGNPFLYYGEELGMLGKKPDENIREAFLWDIRSKDRHRTQWRKPRFNTDSRVTPLALQSENPDSLYHHYRTMIRLRKENEALWQVSPPNLRPASVVQEGVFAFIRPHVSGDLLVIQNLRIEEVTINVSENPVRVVYTSAEFANSAPGIFTVSGYGMIILEIS